MQQLMLRSIFWISVSVVSVLCPTIALSNVRSQMPDFYAEPGLNPFRDQVSANADERIDPFSGSLHLGHVDLFIPGNGGLDIKIQRSYNSNNVYFSRKREGDPLSIAPNLTQLLPRTPYGVGWSLHFGRVLKSGDSSTLCNTSGLPNDTLDNPILELPDGSQQILFVNSTSFSATYITKEQWVANCITGGLLVISPEGLKYAMNFLRTSGVTTYTTEPDNAWYTTRIEDRNGNFLTITYNSTAPAGKEPVFNQITSSDGRTVTFNYTAVNTASVRLNAITSNGQTWTYIYQSIGGTTHYHLNQVAGPNGFNWQYTYYTLSAGAAGNRMLNQVRYPYGGLVEYSYGYECRNALAGDGCNSTNDNFYSLVVDTKANFENGVRRIVWNYDYQQTATEDITTVTLTNSSFPSGTKIEYRHFGSKTFLGGPTIPGQSLWKIGLLKQKRSFQGPSSTPVSDETYTWVPSSSPISIEEYVRPPFDGHDEKHPHYSDIAVYLPVLTQKQVVRDLTTYTTTYSDFDASFNPHTIVESGQATRTTALTYFPRNAGQNIVRLVEDETVTMQGEGVAKTIDRTFDPANANLLSISRYGVVDIYTYFPNGNPNVGEVNTRTDARGKVWTYTNYKRGIPQNETHPEGVTVSRVVNDSGTIASETNGRGFPTSYTYDGMNRLTGIQRTLGLPITVSWNVSGLITVGRTVTRGSFTQAMTFDPFGRTASVNTSGIVKGFAYDELGRKSFETYLSSSFGRTYTTDILGRVTSMVSGGTPGDTRGFAYLAANQVRITTTRAVGESFPTTYSYRSFGDPDNTRDKVLLQIDAPESVSTIIDRNVLGQIKSATQGGLPRTYTYFPSNSFLQSVTNPETGTTTFGRDQVGNMISRQVGSALATGFVYDGFNRLTNINYPAGTPSATYVYDGNSNVTSASNGGSSRSYGYDQNDNLSSENLNVNGVLRGAAYSYNTLDYLQSITYPSTQVVSLVPDALGRPTIVSPYIMTAINYHPTGIPSSFKYATPNDRWTVIGLNQRQWVSEIQGFTPQTWVMNLAYDYDGVGNVRSISDTENAGFNRALTYDGLDRLKTASGAWGSSGSFGYDTRGNITSQSLGAFNLSYAYGANNRLNSISGSKPYSFTYDVYGNVTSNGTHNFVYDDASNLRSFSGPTGAVNTYDANNMRVRMQQGGKDTTVFYAKNGDLLGEYDADGRFKEYFYLGGKLIAQRGVSPSNQNPTANAGANQTANEGQLVTLNGSASSDPENSPLTFAWGQTSGPTVNLANANTPTPSFIVPCLTGSTTLVFRLTVDDGDYGTSSASVNVQVTKTNPDCDNDGLADAWEGQYFGSLAFGPNDDPDGDGVTNLQEFNGGTNPIVSDPAPGPVTSVSANGGIGSNTLSWQTVPRAASYNIYWRTTPGVTKANGNKIAGVTTPYAHPNLTNGTTYYYVVTAQNNNGESAESPEVSATPSIAPLIPILDLLLED